MTSPLPYVLVGVGAYVLTHHDDAPATPTPVGAGASPKKAAPAFVPAPRPQVAPGANMSMPIGAKAAALRGRSSSILAQQASNLPTKVVSSTSVSPSPLVSKGSGNHIDSTDAAVRGQLKKLEDQAKGEYDKLTDAGKKAGAKALNEALKPSPGLTGDESWEEASSKVGAVLGAAGGTAACAAIPIPGLNAALASTVCATLGSMVGSYLGEKLGTWGRDAYNEVKADVDKAWTEASNWVADTASDAYDDVTGFVGDLF